MFRFEFNLSRDKYIHLMKLFSSDRSAKQLYFHLQLLQSGEVLHMGKDISNHSKWFVFTLCFIVLLGPVNAVLFNVALEDMAHDLSISQSKVSWVVVGYSLVVGIGSMIYGKLADRYSVKKTINYFNHHICSGFYYWICKSIICDCHFCKISAGEWGRGVYCA